MLLAQPLLDEKEVQRVGNWRIVAFGKVTFDLQSPAAAYAYAMQVHNSGGTNLTAPANTQATPFPTTQQQTGSLANATATQFPSTPGNQVPVPTRIDASQNPAAKWDVFLAPGQSKTFQIALTQGTTMGLTYLESTRNGTVTFETFTLQEGLNAGIKLPITQTRDFPVVVKNPTNQQLTFTLYLDVR